MAPTLIYIEFFFIEGPHLHPFSCAPRSRPRTRNDPIQPRIATTSINMTGPARATDTNSPQ